MSKESGLVIGTVIFAVLGVIAAVVFYIYIGMKSPQQAVSANRKYRFDDVELGWCRC